MSIEQEKLGFLPRTEVGETRTENGTRFFAANQEPLIIRTEQRLDTKDRQIPEQKAPKPKIPSGINDDFSWISFIGHAIWKGPVVSALVSVAYMLWVYGGSAAYATETALALSAFPFLPVVAIVGFAVGLLWAWNESASGD